MNGPLATAGSKPILDISIGMKLPAMLATVMAAHIARPITKPRTKLCFQKPTSTKIETPVTTPVTSPVTSSFPSSLKKSDRSISSVASLLTATAKLCVPAFPAVPVMVEMKTAKMLA